MGAGRLVGLGGIWTEALDDVRLMPADLAARAHRAPRSASSKAPACCAACAARQPVDIAAIADVAMRVGALMRARPEIREIDINPLVAYPRRRAGAVDRT